MNENISDNTSPVSEWVYTCTEEELYRCLMKGEGRKAGPVRLWIQTGVLAVLAVSMGITFVWEGYTRPQSLVVGVIALVLIVVMWMAPIWRYRHDARQLVEAGKAFRVFLFADGLSWDTPDDPRPFSELKVVMEPDLVILQLPYGALVPIPQRVLSKEEWNRLITALTPPTAGK